ncbi:MAG: DNA polymerase III subunit beta [Candidatus Terrybacteria bacterium RIFCSPLOWO2_01_FULL_44_24]|uniref:Beta sliding clamp n=1 Tax=Candidatus Terrybacteria bacterium RIFCSPHIGHO2_01_FULL_43_35 TaxID=1802361 RepID=A0A1G2PGE4_9BACT|nr:MAG: DNA polymerase III subunit beta [Candidatus Terrybacteria bacterium RIFCSPHIGHO2_01_FULL_43_35]OHA50900.1 MAG: DNA polymerase III subunit beta [Candidatus Terrybacteria bacterium RIFCSPLOWO2_01_FULL_44_24]
MDITCLPEHFREGLRVVERIWNKHATLPILQNILIKTEDSGLSFQSTNLELGAFTIVPAKIKTKGSVAVPAKILSDVSSTFANEPIHLYTTKQTLFLYIENGALNFKIKHEDGDEFPLLPKINEENQNEIEKSSLLSNLQSLLPLIAVSESRPEISGLFLDFSNGNLTLVATDTFRLGERKIDINKEQKEGQYIIPLQCAQEIIRIFSAVQESKINFLLDKNHIEIRAGKTSLVSRLIDGNYPNYKHIIPQETKTTFVVAREVFLNQVRAANILTSRLNDIHLSFKTEAKTIEIKSEDPNKGVLETKVETKSAKGESVNAVFNSKYLIDGLEGFKDENITFYLCGENKPGMIRPEKEENKQLYLLMPIKL